MMMTSVVAAAELEPKALTAPDLRSETVTEGSAKKRVFSGDTSDLVVFFGGEQHGSMDTCGCIKAPRGGFPRTAKMVNLTKQHHPNVPVLLVNVGGWLSDTIGIDGSLRSDIKLANEWMIRGLDIAEWDVANIGFQELPYLDEIREFPPIAVSANLISLDDSPLPKSHVILDFEGLRVGVTGVSGQGLTFMEPEHYRFDDPVERLRGVVTALQPQVDLVLVLGYGLGRLAPAIAEVEGVDVLIEGDRHHARYPLSLQSDTLWLRSRYETQTLGELRLWVDAGAVTRAHERTISLDEQVAGDPALKALLEQADKGVTGARRALLQPGPDAPSVDGMTLTNCRKIRV